MVATCAKKYVLRSASLRIFVSTTVFTSDSSPSFPPARPPRRSYSVSAPASPVVAVFPLVPEGVVLLLQPIALMALCRRREADH